MPLIGLRISRVRKLHGRAVVMGFGGVDLILRALDLLRGADLREGLKMLARGVELALRLDHGDLGVIDEFLRQRALLLQVDPAVVNFLRGVERLLRGHDVGFGFGAIFGYRGAGHGLQSGLGLFKLTLAFFGGGGEIAAFEFGEQLTRLDVIAAIHQNAADGCADLGRHVGLVDGIKHGVGLDDDVNGAARHIVHLDRGGGLGFVGFLLLGLAAAGRSRRPEEEQDANGGGTRSAARQSSR